MSSSRGEKKQPFCSFSELFETGNLVPGRPITSLSRRKIQPRRIRKTSTLVTKMKGNSCQRDHPHSQGFFSVEGRRVGKDFKREFKDLSAVKGFFSHCTSHGPHCSGITASIEAAKISLLHPTFMGVWNSRDQPRRRKALGTMLA